MEIGNGIGRWKPLNAHVNLHRLLFCILHILGEICTATKVLHHRSGQSDNYHFQLWTCSLRLWNRRGKYDMGENIKVKIFSQLLLLLILQALCLPMHLSKLKAGLSYCFFLCLCKLQSGQVAFVLVAPGQVSPPACLVSHICWANAFRIFKCNAPGSQVGNKKINRCQVNWND